MAIHIIFITSFALKACVSPALIGRPLTMGARPIVACARSDAKNPNNEAYWLSRQYKERPANWKAKASETKRSSQLTAKANAAAAKTQATVRFIGKVMHSVNLSAKRVLGEKTQVLKAGSIMKHTDIATSDLDIYLQLPDAKQMTTQDKRLLAEDLRHHVGKRVREVQERSKSIKLIGANGMTVDIVPSKATFRDPIKMPTPAPKDRLHNNPKAQDVVRNLKLYSDDHKKGWKGRIIEGVVLQEQRAKAGQSTAELYKRALMKMKCKSCGLGSGARAS